MTDFVLVHGGAHGSWCWEHLVPHLNADPRVGTVLAVDLPGPGRRDIGKAAEEITREDCIAALVADIEAASLRDVVLVGHSLAGTTIPFVAERIPGRLRRLVYLTALSPPAGKSVDDVMKHPLSPLSRGFTPEYFCTGLDATTREWLLGNLVGEPRGPSSEPMRRPNLPSELARTYIVCETDEALPAEFQREQAADAGIDEVVTIDAGHSAFAEKPEELAALLLRYA